MTILDKTGVNHIKTPIIVAAASVSIMVDSISKVFYPEGHEGFDIYYTYTYGTSGIN
jgi:hypothetical protein